MSGEGGGVAGEKQMFLMFACHFSFALTDFRVKDDILFIESARSREGFIPTFPLGDFEQLKHR